MFSTSPTAWSQSIGSPKELMESSDENLINTYENLLSKEVKETNFKYPGPSKRLTKCNDWARDEIRRPMAK